MKKFFSFVIRQFVAIILIVVFVLGFGIYSTVSMPVNLLPDINVPMVCIQVIWAGAPAQTVETEVTQKLEDGLSSIGGVTSVSSYSYDNLSAVVLSFDYGTDTAEKQTDISGKLPGLGLPEDITADIYDIDLNAEALAVLSVTSQKTSDDGENLRSAYASAQKLKTGLAAIDGVESVEIMGGPQKVYAVRPFKGLELAVPLFVQTFSYGSLKLPLGSVSQNGQEVNIQNNTDITSAEDILNAPVSLPSSIAAMLSGVKRVLGYYEQSTADDLVALRDDLNGGVAQVLAELGGMTAEKTASLAELKTYMDIAERYTAQRLTSFKTGRYYSDIYSRVEGKTDEELADIAAEITDVYSAYLPGLEVSADLLKVVRDGKIDQIIQFRTQLESSEGYIASQQSGEYYEFTQEDYVLLAQTMELDCTEEDILFVQKTSASGLNAIAQKKREQGDDYYPTDGECALLFAGTTLSDAHPVVMLPAFMAFVRADSYEANMQTLIDKRPAYGQTLTAAQFYEVYSSLDLTGVADVTLSEELIGFIISPSTDFSDIVTDAGGNGVLVVKVGDIASVEEEERFSSYVYFGGDGVPQIVKGVTVNIYKSNGANASAVVKNVNAVCAEYSSSQEAQTERTQIVLLDDQSAFISDSISNVLVSMLIGGLLAVIVIFLFLKKVKTSLIIAVTMPLSVLASMICLYLMGITLNMVSLGGLAVGIGMLVDNSIVVIESISKHRDMDKTAFMAAVDGTCEVGGALFGSTLTTVCVFIPIIFSGGLTGEIFTDLSYAVIFSLTLSLVVAVTVIPALYALFFRERGMLRGGKFKKALADPVQKESLPPAPESAQLTTDCSSAPPVEDGGKKEDTRAGGGAIMKKITSLYGKILPHVLNRKLITIICAAAVFGASVGLLFVTGTEFLPSIDKGQLEVSLVYESGVSLEDIQKDVWNFAQSIDGEFGDNVSYVSVSVGKNGLLALADTGIIKVQLKTNRGTQKAVERIRQMAEEDQNKIKGRSGVSVKEIDGVVASLMSGSDDLSVTVTGEDNDELVRIADEIVQELKKPQNGFKDVKSSATEKAVRYNLQFDRAKLAHSGLDYQTAVLTLRIGLSGYTACTATIHGDDCEIEVAFDKSSVLTLDDLENFVLGYQSTGDGSLLAVKLKDVLILDGSGGIPHEEVEACVRHSDGKKMVSVSAVLPGVDTGTAGDKMLAVAKEVLARPQNAGYSFEQSGITEYLNDAFRGLAVALVISFFLLYAVMAVQFGSAVKPLIIMAGIPFSFTGGFIALAITGTSLNVVSFIGLIMLMGVVVNNAIVMLEKIKQLHADGMPHYEAVQQACKVRLRPIFMTTLTTILALIPLAIGLGQGSELMQPLGIVVIGGLLIGTLVTLVLVPAVYCAVYGISKSSPNGRRKA